MRFVPVGDDAILVELASVADCVALYAAARSAGVEATDIVPAARTVLFDGVADPAALVEQVRSLQLELEGDGSVGEPSGRVVEVPVVYDGADLEDVARRWGMTLSETVGTHTATDFVVAFSGFAPGFAYCTGLPAALSVPRLPSPRPRVPAGSVAVAGEYTGVYPAASPGGWRLLGRTDLQVWDPAADDPAMLSPGTRVRFVEVAR
jgi:KipI family sensor histidine kinase inhibitor